ncbi:Rop-like [Allochromatium warmingii]|uniref:Rop-like n=1 Tax=Allochromatium warmingii TaxID=61595 RepID=A0A1H3DXH4_ALLWA|nr:CCE_0567 family metalloprotein [Allochromatium warmingii]SDX71173.1 Rop-like [Allochromatium warmingii]
MTPEELKALEKAVSKAKRLANERASELHDLIEDRLPAAYAELPALAQATYDACRTWAEADAQLKTAIAAESLEN